MFERRLHKLVADCTNYDAWGCCFCDRAWDTCSSLEQHLKTQHPAQNALADYQWVHKGRIIQPDTGAWSVKLPRGDGFQPATCVVRPAALPRDSIYRLVYHPRVSDSVTCSTPPSATNAWSLSTANRPSCQAASLLNSCSHTTLTRGRVLSAVGAQLSYVQKTCQPTCYT